MMTLATGNKDPLRRYGFSLIEVVLVLALIAIASTVVIANFTAMANRGDRLNTTDVIRAAVREARTIAARERTVTSLRFDKDKGALLIEKQASEIATHKLNEDFEKLGSSIIKFYLVPPSEGLEPLKPAKDAQLEASAVKFAPDRSSNPFVIEIDTGSSSSSQRIIFDPFSSLTRTEE